MTTVDLNGTTIDVAAGVTVVRLAPDDRDRVIGGRADVVGPMPVAASTPAPAPAAAPPAAPDRSADIAAAEAAVAEARAALAQAEAGATGEGDATNAVGASEARLEVAQAGAAAARRALGQAREARADQRADDETRRTAAAGEVDRLQKERIGLEASRVELFGRLVEIGDVPDPKPVRDALAGLQRLREVKPKPSARAIELADAWAAARRGLAQLPQPPAPPEWLVTPALAALHEARDALAEAERASIPESVDQAKVDVVERCHRELLDAEQRVMAKASRGNRKRLDQATAAEKEALAAIGVGSYGEYLQRIAPSADGGGAEDRVAAARAAVADAEAVWEELHGGQASPEYTAAKEKEAAIRAEALALLGREATDDELERRLRAHLETVVDTGWAESALADALQGVGANVDGDLEQWAASWLDAIPAQQQRRADVEASLAAIDARLTSIDAELAEQQAQAFFGDESAAAPGAADPYAELQLALDEADAAERDAVEALAAARRAAEEARGAQASVSAARGRLAEAERELEGVRREVAAAASPPPAPAAAEAAAATPSTFEADVWLVARLAASAASDAGALLVDSRAATSARAKRALEKLAARRPIVVLGDDGDVVAWAEGLGDRATVRSI